jgi:hypothetical protein
MRRYTYSRDVKNQGSLVSVVSRLRAGGSGSVSRQGQEIFLSSETSGPKETVEGWNKLERGKKTSFR